MPAMKELLFHIHDFTPHTLSMDRLAEYLKHLASLLGSKEYVHFLRVSDGSASCMMEVEEQEQEQVIARVEKAKRGEGPKEAIVAHTTLRSLLDEDQTSAELELENGDVILDFPLSADEKEQTFGPFWQDGTLDGILVKIGGIDATVPVCLADERTYHNCNASREMAKQLAPHLFGNPIRVHGRGRWLRNSEGKWEMQWFDISHFEELDNASLPEMVSRLRAIPGNDLMSLKDPLEEMRRIRHGKE